MSANARLVFDIAGQVFAIGSDRPMDTIRLAAAYRAFFSTRSPDVVVEAFYDGLPRISLRDEDKVFDSEVTWSLYQTGEQNIFVLKGPTYDPNPYRLAIFDKYYRRGEIHWYIPDPDQMVDGLLPGPLEFPLFEVLMVCLLGQDKGLMVHACGVDDDGRGYLFTGNSTHGKTTMARLWEGRARILNDDRIIVRRYDGRLWMYSTPWHGEYPVVSPDPVPLDRIFFLRHAPDNDLRSREGVAASSTLLARCFPPFWDRQGMAFTLDFCAQVIAETPCYELGFVPEADVVDFVRCVK